MNVLSNTTVLSNFAAVGQLDRLRQLFGEISISVEVYQEVCEGLAEGYSFYSSLNPAISLGWIRLVSMASREEITRFLEIPAKLHQGEASCLAIASERGWLFLSDDLAARRIARSMRVRVSGSLGILTSGVKRDLWPLPKANEWLDQMIAQGFYSPVRDLAALLT